MHIRVLLAPSYRYILGDKQASRDSATLLLLRFTRLDCSTSAILSTRALRVRCRLHDCHTDILRLSSACRHAQPTHNNWPLPDCLRRVSRL